MTYQSHVLLEQAVVFVGCLAGLPRDVFNFYMYYGVLGTCIEHCGYEVRLWLGRLDSMHPVLPCLFHAVRHNCFTFSALCLCFFVFTSAPALTFLAGHLDQQDSDLLASRATAWKHETAAGTDDLRHPEQGALFLCYWISRGCQHGRTRLAPRKVSVCASFLSRSPSCACPPSLEST